MTNALVASHVDVSIVSPVYGCAGCLEELAERVRLAMTPLGLTFELLLVDDGSPDGAWARICEISAIHPWVKGVRLSRNFGQHYAISAGIVEAAGDRIVVMDCDLQDRPEEIPALLAAIHPGVDTVLAQRVERQDGALKRLGSWSFYRALSWLTGVPHDHTTANFGVYSRRIIDLINSMPESDRFFPLMVKWTGLPHALVQVDHGRRTEGKSTYSLRRLVRLAVNVALSYSDKPLRMVVITGLAFASLSLVVVAYSLYRYLSGDIQVAGYTSLIASVWLMGSLVLSSIGIVGLYLGRLFIDAKRRPHFVVAERTWSNA
jgi:glycosyltransferase involved in cell wall biosynthesis